MSNPDTFAQPEPVVATHAGDVGGAGPGLASALLRSPKGLAGALLVSLAVATAILAPLIVPHDPSDQVLAWRLTGPAWSANSSPDLLLGGDNLGRDIFSRLIMGAQVSIGIALIVVCISTAVGTLLGLLAGYFGGVIDAVVMRFADFQLALPFMLLALIFMAILGPGFLTLVVALSFAFWVNFTRVVRSETIKIARMEYVEAARSIGVSDWKIIVGHVLPNILPSVLVIATLDFAHVIIAEAGLSFLGLGIQPPTPSWGMMISEGRDFLYDAPWMVLGPGIAVLLTAVGINLLGDFLRDALDPRLKRKQ